MLCVWIHLFSLFFHFSYFLIFSHLINYFSFLFNRGFTVYFVLYYDPNLLILFCFVLFGLLYMLTSICRSENRVQTAACWLFLLHSTFWFFNLISHYKLFYFFIWLLIACMLCSDLYFIVIFLFGFLYVCVDIDLNRWLLLFVFSIYIVGFSSSSLFFYCVFLTVFPLSVFIFIFSSSLIFFSLFYFIVFPLLC